MNGLIDLVYSAAQDSDFLVYHGMGDIMYELHNDGSFKLVFLELDVLGKVIGQFNFTQWSMSAFRVWSASCGCDYISNPPKMGAVKLYQLINANLQLDESALIDLVASKALGASSYAVNLLSAVRSFQHHVVFEAASDGAVKQVHLQPLPHNRRGALGVQDTHTTAERRRLLRRLDPTTLGPRLVVEEVDGASQPALEADFSAGQRPAPVLGAAPPSVPGQPRHPGRRRCAGSRSWSSSTVSSRTRPTHGL